MEKSIVIAIILICIGGVLWKTVSNIFYNCKTHHDTYEVVNYQLPDSSYQLLLADTPTKWEYGLMNVKSKSDICGADGMLFKFPVALPQTFWNKNTLINLDVYWLKNDTVVGKDFLPSITQNIHTTIASPKPVNMVVEIIR